MEVEDCRKLWAASDTAPKAWVPDRSSCPRLSAVEIRRVAGTFPKGTASSSDHFHPRHALLLEEEALDVLSLIWQPAEAIGMLPKQLCWIQMHMLPKASGGNRLIILCAGLYRIWQPARRWMISGIAVSLERKFWGAGKGISAIGCAWLQSARSEADRSD
eukprot:2192595-Pyramimonas_sp.AAC.1